MIGVGSATPVGWVERESGVAAEAGHPFGVGLMAWVLQTRPELLDAAIAARPALISISFGSPRPWAERVRGAGIKLASQVQDRASALEAADAGADLVVAQGTEAGGHTGSVGTLPLLQIVLDSVDRPVLAAGGIASARGVAAVMAAGAEGVWVGTAFLAAHESQSSPAARRRVIEAGENDTVHTHLFDRLQDIPWPEAFPGRALRNSYTDRWDGREDALEGAAVQAYRDAVERGDFDIAHIYAGQAVGLVKAEAPAGDIVRSLMEGAERLLEKK